MTPILQYLGSWAKMAGQPWVDQGEMGRDFKICPSHRSHLFFN